MRNKMVVVEEAASSFTSFQKECNELLNDNYYLASYHVVSKSEGGTNHVGVFLLDPSPPDPSHPPMFTNDVNLK